MTHNVTDPESSSLQIGTTYLTANVVDNQEIQSELDWKDGKFLVAEYYSLNSHYFHEDNYFLRAIGLFGTINAALLTFYGSNIIVHVQTIIRIAFIAIGIVTTIAWAISLVRVRYLRRKIEDRLAELEASLTDFWTKSNGAPLPFPMLKIRNRQETAKYWPQRVPVSQLMLVIPIAFLIIWLFVLTAFYRTTRSGRDQGEHRSSPPISVPK